MPEKAPAFTLTSDENKPVSLPDFAGKRVLLFFFQRAGTGGCTQQACGFRDAFPKIKETNAVVLGISPDSPAALAKWKAKEKLPYTLLSDPDHKVIDAYGVWGEKVLYGKKYMGVIRSHFIIDGNGDIVETQRKVSPKVSVERGVKSLIQEK